MHILSIELKDYAFSAETGQFHATLLMDADTRRMSLRAAADYQQGMLRQHVAEELLDDALRQLNRMPEYRNTSHQITVAQDALRASTTMLQAA
ncbi:MAG: hypothetical protein AB8B82_11530 [Roseovarius sp.]